MHISEAAELGDRMRDQRTALGMSQQALADAIGASRHWVIKIEQGNAGAEVGLVLKALNTLGLVIDVRSTATLPDSNAAVPVVPSLSDVLDRVRNRRSDVR